LGLPKGDEHQLSVFPPLDQPYFIVDDIPAPAGPGLEIVKRDIDLKRGMWITGRVTDNKTGDPVQAAIHYYPRLDNEHAKDHRNFQANRFSANWTGSRYRTDDQGRYRVVALPGRGVV